MSPYFLHWSLEIFVAKFQFFQQGFHETRIFYIHKLPTELTGQQFDLESLRSFKDKPVLSIL